MSAQTTSGNVQVRLRTYIEWIIVLNIEWTLTLLVQDVIESRLEKRKKGVYVPTGGKIMIVFMDDFNMPMKEKYGSQPPLELIRQWIDYGFW